MNTDIKKLGLSKKIWNIVGWAGVLLAVAAMIGLLVVVVLIGLKQGTPVLMGALAGGFAGGLALLGGLAFLGLKLGERYGEREQDAMELADGENSFSVGDGIFATFEESSLRIHGQAKGNERTVPYGEMRFFSVCSRRRPKERGDWCVVMEIPAHYLSKKAKKTKEERPLLVQTKGKERLYRCLEAHGLYLLGEQPPRGKAAAQKFTPLRTFQLPNTAKRRRALCLLALGIVLAGGGVGLAFWNTTVGAVVLVVGCYLAARAVASFVKAKAQFTIYREGVFYREPSGADDVFLKWEEISRFSVVGQEEKFLRAECLYGAFEFPLFAGAFDALKEQVPERCGEGEA